MIILEENEMSIRQLRSEDSTLLHKWLSDPVVLEYYEGRDHPHDIALINKHFYENREGITSCIIQYKGKEIGYIQFYLIDEEEKEIYGYVEFDGKIYGMDQFIGEVEFWNKGIGSRVIKEMRNYLISNKEAKIIVMDPQAWNTRALRVYEKNGFIKKKLLEQHEWHEGELRDCWLMEYEVNE
ncbi:GNAT family N-acetyltransferase [Paenibacillus antarcticus]|uniref:GNAT family N-acetyltransferase n=1 Tax=Paenibacillus antarcticus TaxID=253703 RepID=A0A168PWD9_9BACL|nr:GNAT family N-acetyltransferase [Paenibacillus antarcticus]OAB47136.1 GNAT family N-acetyltransferase [Paenibacillus antarcticus]